MLFAQAIGHIQQKPEMLLSSTISTVVHVGRKALPAQPTPFMITDLGVKSRRTDAAYTDCTYHTSGEHASTY